MRFIHTADWQLGKPFGRFEAETRAALTEARFDAIDTLGKAAAEHGAGHVLVAGEVRPRRTISIRRVMNRARRCWLILSLTRSLSRRSGLAASVG